MFKNRSIFFHYTFFRKSEQYAFNVHIKYIILLSSLVVLQYDLFYNTNLEMIDVIN